MRSSRPWDEFNKGLYPAGAECRDDAEYIVEQRILIREQCEKPGLPYYETAWEYPGGHKWLDVIRRHKMQEACI